MVVVHAESILNGIVFAEEAKKREEEEEEEYYCLFGVGFAGVSISLPKGIDEKIKSRVTPKY